MTARNSPKKPSDSYLRYSGLAFQFLAAIAIGVVAGNWLDKKFQTSSPVFTIILSLFFIIASLILVIRDLLKSDKERGMGEGKSEEGEKKP